MKIKIFFLISAMNALSYLCFGNCCDDCCKNCWNCWEEYFGKEIGNQFFLEGKENPDEETKEIKKIVNEDWLKDNNVKFKFYEEKKEENKEADIKVIKYKNGKIGVKKFELENDTHKWALFEIKYKEEGKGEDKLVYLYCSDIGSTVDNGIFRNMENFSSISVLTCNTSNVTNMNCMFSGCSNLKNLDLSNFNTSKVTDMSWMFYSCSSLKNLDLSKFNTSKVTNMSYMFFQCSNLETLGLSKFDTKNVKDMSFMFSKCTNLKNLDLSKFDTSKVNNMKYMFSSCNSLNKVIVNKEENTKTKIFTQLNEDVGEWEESKDNGKFILIKNQN